MKKLQKANADLARRYPGDSTARQPVHTLIIGAHLFAASAIPEIRAQALAALDDHAPTGVTLARVLDFAPGLGCTVRERVIRKLKLEPVEDLRLDFEDGYGLRPDREEDGHARAAAQAVADAVAQGTAPPYVGIRIKPMSRELHQRSLRTLDLFVSSVVKAADRALPPNFAVTITKVMTPAHVTVVAEACAALERKLKLAKGALKLELMIETPQAVLAPDGSCAIGPLVAAGNGRVRAALFGTYDYTTLCNVSAASQQMRHAACDFAKEMMRVALSQTGIWLSDGATNVMPVGSRDAIHRAWRTQYLDIQHSLKNGFYQGWDLHAAQLPARFASIYAFYLSALPAATSRLQAFVERASQATLLGEVFDDVATGQALLNFFVRGLSSGALTVEEAQATGLTMPELDSRSFAAILASRRSSGGQRTARGKLAR